MKSETPLRERLRSAVAGRLAALRNGRSHRKDIDALRAAIGRIEAFQMSYPHADDERVRNWCLAHIDDVAMVVPGNQPTQLARLVVDELGRRANTGSAA